MLEPVTTCPECQGAGFVVGDESASRVRCLSCDGTGALAADKPRTPAVVSASRDVRATSPVALADEPHPTR